MFSHEKLVVYQKSLVFFEQVYQIIKVIPPGYGDMINQFRRAGTSITLNIAEGAGRTGSREKKRFYSFARGSALECAALLDLLLRLKVLPEKSFQDAHRMLHEIASLLSVLAR